MRMHGRDEVERRFARILAEHGAALARVASGYAACAAEREDLAQEIALAIWRALPRFRGECGERTFVHRIAHNRCLSHVLRRRPATAEVEPADPRPGVEERLLAAERRERLLAAVRALPLAQREVVLLALEGLAHAEIAEVVGITKGNVAVRLARARERLGAILGGTG